MIDESKIPLLQDLIAPGQLEPEPDQPQLSADQNNSIEIDDDQADETAGPIGAEEDGGGSTDELEQDTSIKELIIDEEIRMILDKHMDRAYEEIIRLLSHKIS